MQNGNRAISREALDEIYMQCDRNRGPLLERFGRQPRGCVVTFGCQQNEADSELIRAMLLEMGCRLTDRADDCDILIFNTCAIREHAETRVLGHLGEVSHLKHKNPRAIAALCGCMAQQGHVAEKVKASYPYIDMVFGTHALGRFPELLAGRLGGGRRAFDLAGDARGVILEGLTPRRAEGPLAWLSIMYGCNNYCSYCVVPHVRGRERSREADAVAAEFEGLIAAGYKDITLLGQNVNSYGKDLTAGVDFPALLERLCATAGEYRIRFMTSHPKDAGRRLFDVMAAYPNICSSIHLPVQAGSDRVLHEMNRRYTTAQYLELVDYARAVMPGLGLTSDIIVGFPGETEPEFEETLALLERVRFDSLFTFIYSPRKGTKAADLPDPASREEKQRWFDRLLDTQNRISREINDAFVGQTLRVLVSGPGEDALFPMQGRTDGFKLVHLRGAEGKAGQFVDVYIEKRSTWALFGRVK